MLYSKLVEIKEELNEVSSDIGSFKEGLDIKLNRIEDNYNQIIENNCNYILSRSNYKVFKALERFEKKKEKEDGEKINRGFIQDI